MGSFVDEGYELPNVRIPNTVPFLNTLPVGTVVRGLDEFGEAWVAHRIDDGRLTKGSPVGPLWMCENPLTTKSLVLISSDVTVRGWLVIYKPVPLPD